MALRAATYPSIEVNGKRSYQSSNSDMEPVYKCSVKYIDDNDNGDFTFGKEHLGYKLLYDVCLKLNVIETDYFGLRFVDKTGQRHWLNPMKPITKQLGLSQPPYLLCFRVKYYPRDLSIIQEEITRYQLFLQVKRDLEHGRLLSTRSEAALLCAYVLQATLGPYDERDLPPGYSQEMKLAAAYKDNEFFDEVEQYHKVKVKDVSTGDAERSFLLFASTMQTYGVDPYPCKSDQGTPLHFSFTWKGLCLFEKNKLSKLFPWANVVRITIDGRFLKVVANERGIVKPYKTLFDFGTEANSKHVWSSAVEHMVFFTQQAGKPPKKIRSSRSLLKRGTSLKFTGRTADQLRSTSLGRKAPSFERTPSMRERSRVVNRSLDRSTGMSRSTLMSPNPSVDLSNDLVESDHSRRSSLTVTNYQTPSHMIATTYTSATLPRPSSERSPRDSRDYPDRFSRDSSGYMGVNGSVSGGSGGGGGGEEHEWKSQSVTQLSGVNTTVDSGYSTSSKPTVVDDQATPKPKWANKVREDWSRAQNISDQLKINLPSQRPGSMTEPAFNSRDSTLDITNSYQQKMANSPEKFGRTISRDTVQTQGSYRSRTSSEEESLPSAGELRDSIRRFMGDSGSEPEIIATRGSDSQLLQAMPNEEEKRTFDRKLPTSSSTHQFPANRKPERASITTGTVYETLITQSRRQTNASSPNLSSLKRSSFSTSPKTDEPKKEIAPPVIEPTINKSLSHQEQSFAEPLAIIEKDKIDKTLPENRIEEPEPSAVPVGEPNKPSSALKSIVFEAYFILGVICGIIFLTVLIAETDEPKRKAENTEPATEAEEAIVVTNSMASFIRHTFLFSMFYDGIYSPIRSFLVQYLSWMFQT